ncbi:phage major capsid protein [Mycobacterium avium subsp. hominissuis]|uniref:phage major capsid protein n=1 Tax=Mycobacterium avium TaxID=1764 RepID=UPI000452D615|nr:phage major capsid protein [Mycobacterium avium]ETZ54629.1 phage major capsid protein, HK97 family [Mycobacterium avium MAV_120709_2344]MBG0730010.1 phage major capsid protein [Mycobacterium avium]MCA2338080.1 phage major capsid protein [Mycobacterium avium]MDV3219637.1 phage major capsid protein [Mycobacterium avium]PBA40843.1 phage major capsid protein [Mycobacterium avium]
MSTITTTTTDFPWRPDTTSFAPVDAVPSALILQTSTVAGVVNGDEPAVRVAYVADSADADYVAEGAEFTDSEPDLDEVIIKTRKIGRLVKVSREQYYNQQTAPQLAASVARDLVRRADAAYLGDSTGASIGLLHNTAVVDGGNVDADLDVLIDLVAELEQNGAVPSHILVDPASWASLRKLKVAESWNATLLGASTEDATARLLSLPILRSRFVPAHTGIVVDATQVVSAVGPVEIAVSEHAAFTSDSVLLRAGWRIGWQVIERPSPANGPRVGRFTVGVDAGS